MGAGGIDNAPDKGQRLLGVHPGRGKGYWVLQCRPRLEGAVHKRIRTTPHACGVDCSRFAAEKNRSYEAGETESASTFLARLHSACIPSGRHGLLQARSTHRGVPLKGAADHAFDSPLEQPRALAIVLGDPSTTAHTTLKPPPFIPYAFLAAWSDRAFGSSFACWLKD